MQVNSVQVPESDIMATNGVIHFVKQVLYPGGKVFTQSKLLRLPSIVNLSRDAPSLSFITVVNA